MKKIALLIGASLILMGCSRTATPVETTTGESQVQETGSALPPEETQVMNPSVVVPLTEVKGSGQSGIATIEEVNGKVQVTLDITGQAPGTTQPAHFHTGTCAKPGPVVYPLTNVVDGKSVTMLDATLDEVKTKSTLVNVHKSAKESSVYMSCGEFGGTPSAPSADGSPAVAPGMPY